MKGEMNRAVKWEIMKCWPNRSRRTEGTAWWKIVGYGIGEYMMRSWYSGSEGRTEVMLGSEPPLTVKRWWVLESDYERRWSGVSGREDHWRWGGSRTIEQTVLSVACLWLWKIVSDVQEMLQKPKLKPVESCRGRGICVCTMKTMSMGNELPRQEPTTPNALNTAFGTLLDIIVENIHWENATSQTFW
jgi:hypothetical protein